MDSGAPTAAPVTSAWLRRTWTTAAGTDPGPLDEATELAAAGLQGIPRLLVVAAIEAELDIELPADLVAELRTVGDLLHYADALRAHDGR